MGLDLLLGRDGEGFGAGGVDVFQDAEAGLPGGELGEFGLGRGGIEFERRLALCDEARVVAEERPVAGINRELLLVETLAEVVAVGDAVGIGDDEGGAGIGLGFAEGLHGLAVFRTEGDLGDVDVAVLGGDEGEVFLRGAFAAGGELGDGTDGGGFGGLPAGVGVYLGVEDQDLDVGTGGEDVVEAAVADVVGPAVAADDPDGFVDEVVGNEVEAHGVGGAERSEFCTKGGDAGTLVGDLGLGGLRGAEDRVDEERVELRSEELEEGAGVCGALVGGEAQTEAELGVVFEEGVGPCGAAAVFIGAIRRGGEVAAVDGGAAGGVGHDEAVAVELREEFEVRGLAAAGAGAGEFDERGEELRALHGGEIEAGAVGFGEREEEVPVGAFGGEESGLRGHVDGLVARVGLVLGGADLDAERAAGAVFGRDLKRVFVAGEILGFEIDGFEGVGRAGEGGGFVELGADGGVRADEDALVALDAEGEIPSGDFQGEVAFLEAGGAGGPGAVHGDGADGEVVAVVGEEARGDLQYEGGGAGINGRRSDGGVGVGRGGEDELIHAGEGGVHGGVVHPDDGVALAAVGFGDGFFDLGDGFGLRKDAGEGEEARLQHGVGAAAHAAGVGDGGGVDDEEAEFFIDERDLPFAGKLGPRVGGGVRGVEKNGRAGLGVAEDVLLADEGELAARHEIGLRDEVGCVDGARPETQMRGGDGA